MTIEAIEQIAKTIIESAYEYETALQNEDKEKSEKTRAYMLKICDHLKKIIQEEEKCLT